MSIVTLSTDFKSNDFIVGAMKGQLLSVMKDVVITDISHELTATNYAHTSYVCKNAFKYFPENTIHIVLTDLFRNMPRHLLLVEADGQYVLAPDNGIITMIFGKRMENMVKIDFTENIRTTVDITGVAAQAANELSKGKYIRQIGKTVEDLVEIYPMLPAIGTDWIEGQIIFIDKNSNAIVNITRHEFEEYGKGRKFNIIFSRTEKIPRISNNYAGVAHGNILAWFNSAGYLELSISSGDLASFFGLQDISFSQAMHNKIYQTVRINFEDEPS